MKERSEYEEQAAVFAWSEISVREHPELDLLQGSLNGVRLTIGQAVKAKKSGMKAGYPDCFLPIARHGYHGLFIEMKRRKGGRMSKEQIEYFEKLTAQGYLCQECKGSDSAISILKWYLS